jgi:hypothetical protein
MAINASSNKKTSVLLYLILAAVLGLTAWTAFNSEDEVDASRAGVVVTKEHLPSQLVSLSPVNIPLGGNINAEVSKQLIRMPIQKPIKELFKVHSWFVPPPVKKMPLVVAPAPVAPPLPFTYVGKMEGSTKGDLVFLLANNQLYSVVKGENVTPQWRLDLENETMLRFTFIPLNLPKVLIKSATNRATNLAESAAVNNLSAEALSMQNNLVREE